MFHVKRVSSPPPLLPRSSRRPSVTHHTLSTRDSTGTPRGQTPAPHATGSNYYVRASPRGRRRSRTRCVAPRETFKALPGEALSHLYIAISVYLYLDISTHTKHPTPMSTPAKGRVALPA